MSATICSCGQPKDVRAKQCQACYRRPWSEADDAQLADLVAAGLEYKLIGRRLGRTANACRLRASGRGLKLDQTAILANRKRGRDRFWNSSKKVERWKARVARCYTPDERAVRAEEGRQRNAAGIWSFKGHHHTPEACERIRQAMLGRQMSEEHRKKISEGRKRYWERWRANKPEALAKTAMEADKRHRLAVGEWGEVQSSTESLFWCRQCELRVSAQQAAVCSSKWCKAKALAA